MDKINRIAMRLSKPHSREQVTTKEDSIGMFAANPRKQLVVPVGLPVQIRCREANRQNQPLPFIL